MSNRKNNWSNYWKKGLIDSCADSIQDSESDLNLFWENVAANLEENSVVVDLCTGAGAVVKQICLNTTEKIKISSQFIGVELSEYSGQKQEYLSGITADIRLLSGTSIADMGLAEESVNLITSQYGMEYALSTEFYEEVARILKRSGRLSAILHHKDSVLYSVSVEESENFALAIKELDIIEKVTSLIPFFAMLKNPANLAKVNKNPKAMKARESFNQAMIEIKQKATTSKHPDYLNELLNSLSISLNIAKEKNKKTALEFTKNLKTELEDSYYRSQELITAAMSREDIECMLLEFKKMFSLKAEITELKSKKQIIGWGLNIIRTD